MTMVAGTFFIALLLLASSCAASAASASRAPRTSTSSSTSSSGAKASPFCAAQWRCDEEDDGRLREAFYTELRSHAYGDAAGCISELKEFMCAACKNNATAPSIVANASALPLECAQSNKSVRHDDAGAGAGAGTVCVQKVSTRAFDGLAALQDGSGRVLCWTRNGGEIWLGSFDPTNMALLRVADKPLFSLTNRVSGRGLAGVAVQQSTGQVFVSYYTNDNVDGGGSASLFLVVDQLPAVPSSWTEAGNQELATVRRVVSLPCESEPYYYGGEIQFRPSRADPFLYIVTGPVNTGGQVQAQMLRFSVGQEDMDAGIAQVYASIKGVPRRCEFDSDRPQDLYCAIVEDDQELVFVTSDPEAPSSSATPPIPTAIVAQQRSTIPSIVGGQLYRGYVDNTLTGRYIFMYRSKFWVSGGPAPTARDIQVTCSASTASPQACGGDFTATVTSFGQDASKNAILLTTDGVYIVVGPTLCDDAVRPEAAPPSTTTDDNLVKWILGLIIATLTVLGGGGYVVYKYKIFFNCCNSNTESHGQVQMGSITGNVHVENNYYYGTE